MLQLLDSVAVEHVSSVRTGSLLDLCPLQSQGVVFVDALLVFVLQAVSFIEAYGFLAYSLDSMACLTCHTCRLEATACASQLNQALYHHPLQCTACWAEWAKSMTDLVIVAAELAQPCNPALHSKPTLSMGTGDELLGCRRGSPIKPDNTPSEPPRVGPEGSHHCCQLSEIHLPLVNAATLRTQQAAAHCVYMLYMHYAPHQFQMMQLPPVTATLASLCCGLP